MIFNKKKPFSQWIWPPEPWERALQQWVGLHHRWKTPGHPRPPGRWRHGRVPCTWPPLGSHLRSPVLQNFRGRIIRHGYECWEMQFQFIFRWFKTVSLFLGLCFLGLISPGRNSPLKRDLSEGSPSTPARPSEGEQPPKKVTQNLRIGFLT